MAVSNLRSGSLSILVSQDVLKDNPWLNRFFHEHHFELILVSNGQEVFDQVIKSKPDIVMVNVLMSHISGLDCIRMIKAQKLHIATVLMAHVASPWLASQAIELEVDLYCDPTNREVHTKRFLKKMMGMGAMDQPTLDLSEDLSGASIRHRRDFRCGYKEKLVVVLDGKRYPGFFEDISTHGAKIRLSHIPPIGSDIELLWETLDKVAYERKAKVVRHNIVFEPVDVYVWLIAITFQEQLDQGKGALKGLIDELTELRDKDFKLKDFDHIEKMARRQEGYFRSMLQGERAPAFARKVLQDIKEVEQDALSSHDPNQIHLARLASYRLMGVALNYALDWVIKRPIEGLKTLVPLLDRTFLNMDHLQNEVDQMIGQIKELNTRKQWIEMSNLVLEQKDKLVQEFFYNFKNAVPDEHLKSSFDAIIQRYKVITSHQIYVEQEMKKEDIKMAKVKKVKPMYSLSPDTHQQIEDTKIQKKNKLVRQQIREFLLPSIAAGIFLATLLDHGTRYYQAWRRVGDLNITIPLKSKKIKDLSNLELQVDAGVWDDLTDSQKRRAMDDIEVFMTAKRLNQAKVIDGDELIAVMYSTHDPDRLRFTFDYFR